MHRNFSFPQLIDRHPTVVPIDARQTKQPHIKVVALLLPLKTEESLEKLAADPIVATLIQRMARIAMQQLECLLILGPDTLGDFLLRDS